MIAAARTQVAIIGAGPAGLMLAHLLHESGIDSVVVETRDRAYVEGRVRAAVIEHHTASLLEEFGVGERMRREGLVHRGIELQFGQERHRIDFEELTGRTVTVYGQQEVVKDLIAARTRAGLELRFESEVVALELGAGDRAILRVRDAGGRENTIAADFIAGCDGFHGPSRAAIPPSAITLYEHVFPFAWLGILAESPPVSDELIYANNERGFALVSMRSRTVSRIYLQCRNDEDLARWPDDRIWAELRARLQSDGAADEIVEGRIFQKGVTPMRSFVCDRCATAGSSSQATPPTSYRRRGPKV